MCRVSSTVLRASTSDSHRASTQVDDNSLFTSLPWFLSGAQFLASLERPRKHLSSWPTQLKEQLIFYWSQHDVIILHIIFVYSLVYNTLFNSAIYFEKCTNLL